MYKIFLYLLIFLNFSFALDITPIEVPIYKKIELSKNIVDINDAISNPKKFIEKKYFRHFFHKQKFNSNLWLKIDLENNSNKNLNRSFVTKWSDIILDLYLVEDGKVLKKETIISNDYLKYSSSLLIPKKKKLHLYIHSKSTGLMDGLAYLYIVDSKHLKHFVLQREKLYNHGLFFGILLTMMMYSFFMFFSIKEKAYLYLGVYQLWVLLATSNIFKSYLFILFQEYPDIGYFFLKEVYVYIMFFLTILFTKEFLNTKVDYPKINTFLNLIMIFSLPLHMANTTNINYGTFLYLSYIFIGIYCFYKGNKAALFYTLGFLGFALVSSLINLSRILDWGIYFEFMYARLIFSCIESFILCFALYIKLKNILKEREKAKEESIKHEKMMLEQSKFASMGEMIASIAHQWRQPLNHVTMIFSNLQLANETKKLTPGYLNKKTNEANLQLKYMSDTIEDFSNFFANKGTIEKFTLKDVCKLSLDLVYSRCKKFEIQTSIINDNFKIHINYKNELTQILVVILNNAIDALMLNNIENRKINIEIKGNSIIISDNAGGIPENIIHKIFDPYFSTKDKKLGTGLGLYTAKIIIDTLMKGKISVKNKNSGASFTISLP